MFNIQISHLTRRSRGSANPIEIRIVPGNSCDLLDLLITCPMTILRGEGREGVKPPPVRFNFYNCFYMILGKPKKLNNQAILNSGFFLLFSQPEKNLFL